MAFPIKKKSELLKIIKIIMKIAYGRHQKVRDMCNLNWRSQLPVGSIETI